MNALFNPIAAPWPVCAFLEMSEDSAGRSIVLLKTNSPTVSSTVGKVVASSMSGNPTALPRSDALMMVLSPQRFVAGPVAKPCARADRMPMTAKIRLTWVAL